MSGLLASAASLIYAQVNEDLWEHTATYESQFDP